MKRDNYEEKNEILSTPKHRILYSIICFMKGVLIIGVCLFIMGTIAIVNPRMVESDGIIRRDLLLLTRFIEEEPKDRNVAWNSELPKFILRDMKYAEKNDCEIEYELENIKLTITFLDGIPAISSHIKGDTTSYLRNDVLINFSIYSVPKKGIVVYGEDGELNGNFKRAYFLKGLKKDEYIEDIEILTYDTNIPFTINSEEELINHNPIFPTNKIHTEQSGEYSYIFTEVDEKTGKYQTQFYKNGELISTIPFPEELKWYDQYNGLYLTEKKDFYTSYIDMSNPEKPNIVYYKVGNIDRIYRDKSENIIAEMLYYDGVRSPLLIKDNTFYTIAPKDWKTFKNFSTLSSHILEEKVSNPNYDLELVKLEDYFEYAEFSSGEMEGKQNWTAEIGFNINGQIMKYKYYVDGYDSANVTIAETEVFELSKKVESIEEFIENIHKIRDTYEKYYDFPSL